MADFTQLFTEMDYFSPGIRNRWGLGEYKNSNTPTVFLSLGSPLAIKTFIKHKGYKLLYFSGSDCTPETIELVKNTPNVICIGWSPWITKILEENSIPHKNFFLPLKHYTDFKPTQLGENIYVYKGIHGDRENYFKWKEIVIPLQQIFGNDRVLYTSNQPFDKLINQYYNNCFVYVKPNERGGSTAMWELGYMGRKTISINQGDLPHVLNSNSLEETVELIIQESKKIGTLQPELSTQVHNSFQNTDEWLNLDFYK